MIGLIFAAVACMARARASGLGRVAVATWGSAAVRTATPPADEAGVSDSGPTSEPARAASSRSTSSRKIARLTSSPTIEKTADRDHHERRSQPTATDRVEPEPLQEDRRAEPVGPGHRRRRSPGRAGAGPAGAARPARARLGRPLVGRRQVERGRGHAQAHRQGERGVAGDDRQDVDRQPEVAPEDRRELRDVGVEHRDRRRQAPCRPAAIPAPARAA